MKVEAKLWLAILSCHLRLTFFPLIFPSPMMSEDFQSNWKEIIMTKSHMGYEQAKIIIKQWITVPV